VPRTRSRRGGNGGGGGSNTCRIGDSSPTDDSRFLRGGSGGGISSGGGGSGGELGRLARVLLALRLPVIDTKKHILVQSRHYCTHDHLVVTSDRLQFYAGYV